MGVFFRFDEEGKILVANTLFSSTISDAEFKKKAKYINEDKFFSKFKDDKKELLIKELEMIKEINEKELSFVGPVFHFLPNYGFYATGCYVGDAYFVDFHHERNKRNEAIKYGYKYYGKLFMDSIIEEKYLEIPTDNEKMKLIENPKSSQFVLCTFFSKDIKISEKEYFNNIELRNKLCAIRNVKDMMIEEKVDKRRI